MFKINKYMNTSNNSSQHFIVIYCFILVILASSVLRLHSIPFQKFLGDHFAASADRLHVSLGLPRLRFPSGIQHRASLVMLLSGFGKKIGGWGREGVGDHFGSCTVPRVLSLQYVIMLMWKCCRHWLPSSFFTTLPCACGLFESSECSSNFAENISY